MRLRVAALRAVRGTRVPVAAMDGTWKCFICTSFTLRDGPMRPQMRSATYPQILARR